MAKAKAVVLAAEVVRVVHKIIALGLGLTLLKQPMFTSKFTPMKQMIQSTIFQLVAVLGSMWSRITITGLYSLT